MKTNRLETQNLRHQARENALGKTPAPLACHSTSESVSEARIAAANGSDSNSAAVKERVILLISDDVKLGRDLRMAAKNEGRIVITAELVSDALRTIRAKCSGIVLLDMDLGRGSAFEAADCLLQESSCPPVVLLSGTNKQFEMRMAINAGAITDKSAGPGHILNAVNRVLETPHSARAERNANQRVMVRWLRPRYWSVSFNPAYRFWGINE